MSTHVLMAGLVLISAVSCLFTNSWLMVWTLLEMNTLAFCSLSFVKFTKSTSSAKMSIMKYLIIQSIASLMLIISVIYLNKENSKLMFLITVIPVIAMMLKAASAPIHQWFVTMMKNLNWTTNSVLMTWQKLMPTFLLFYQPKKMITMFILVSSMVGSISLINKTMLKEIMALSSVFNLSWIMASVLTSMKMFLSFSILYWISVLFMMKIFIEKNMSSMKEFSWSKKKDLTPMLMFLSIGGMPPFLGFLAKWLMISAVSMKTFLMMITFLTVTSSINMFIYMRSMNTIMMKNTLSNQKKSKPSSMMTLWLFLFLNSISLTLIMI